MDTAKVTIEYLKNELAVALECGDTPEYVKALEMVIQVISDCNDN